MARVLWLGGEISGVVSKLGSSSRLAVRFKTIMNDEEKRRHKVRRKNKKKRRDKRRKEEARQARIEDRRRRLEAQVERAIQERITNGELMRVSAEPAAADGPPSQTAKRNTTSRKRARNTDCEEVPRKAARLHGLKEIPASHVILTRTCLGSGSYGSCYLGTFRGMNVVVKSLHVHEGK